MSRVDGRVERGVAPLLAVGNWWTSSPRLTAGVLWGVGIGGQATMSLWRGHVSSSALLLGVGAVLWLVALGSLPAETSARSTRHVGSAVLRGLRPWMLLIEFLTALTFVVGLVVGLNGVDGVASIGLIGLCAAAWYVPDHETEPRRRFVPAPVGV